MLKIGERIRELRKARKVTLIELSAKTGVAQATLSRIETGTMIGTVESHQRIAEALGVGLAELYSGVDGRMETTEKTKAEERKAEKREKATIQVLTTSSLKKKMLPALIKLESQGQISLEREEVGVEKFIYCLRGEIEITINKNTYRLKKDESLYFDASFPHILSNPSSRETEAFSVTSPPKI